MIVSIDELQIDLFNRFKKTNGAEFGITKIDFPLKTEKLSLYLEHYRAPEIIYKISFEKILSYVVSQDYLQENNIKDVTYSKDFSSAILKQLDGTKYMDYLNTWTDLKIFFEGEALTAIKQYAVYSQNVMIDIITNKVPIIEIILGDEL